MKVKLSLLAASARMSSSDGGSNSASAIVLPFGLAMNATISFYDTSSIPKSMSVRNFWRDLGVPVPSDNRAIFFAGQIATFNDSYLPLHGVYPFMAPSPTDLFSPVIYPSQPYDGNSINLWADRTRMDVEANRPLYLCYGAVSWTALGVPTQTPTKLTMYGDLKFEKELTPHNPDYTNLGGLYVEAAAEHYPLTSIGVTSNASFIPGGAFTMTPDSVSQSSRLPTATATGSSVVLPSAFTLISISSNAVLEVSRASLREGARLVAEGSFPSSPVVDVAADQPFETVMLSLPSVHAALPVAGRLDANAMLSASLLMIAVGDTNTAITNRKITCAAGFLGIVSGQFQYIKLTVAGTLRDDLTADSAVYTWCAIASQVSTVVGLTDAIDAFMSANLYGTEGSDFTYTKQTSPVISVYAGV